MINRSMSNRCWFNALDVESMLIQRWSTVRPMSIQHNVAILIYITSYISLMLCLCLLCISCVTGLIVRSHLDRKAEFNRCIQKHDRSLNAHWALVSLFYIFRSNGICQSCKAHWTYFWTHAVPPFVISASSDWLLLFCFLLFCLV